MRLRPLALLAVAAVCALTSAPSPAQSAPIRGTAQIQLADPNERRANEIQPPEKVMDLIGIRPGLVIGEVGAGRGRVTVHLASRVGPSGKIYANDINAGALDYLKQRADRLELANVETVLGTVDNARFPAKSLDVVFMAWVFHHVDQPVALLRSLIPALKARGSVVMVEPTPAHTEDSARKLTRELVSQEAQAAGFVVVAFVEGQLAEDNIIVLRPASGSPAPSRPCRARSARRRSRRPAG